jgi:hypothetical protein
VISNRVVAYREQQLENKYCHEVERRGGVAYKFVSPGLRGVPDRLILLPIPEEHREIVSKYVKFREFKHPSRGRLAELQRRQIMVLTGMGFDARLQKNAVI